jgi:hypothetical protein
MSLDGSQDVAMDSAPPPTDEESAAARGQHAADVLAQKRHNADIAAQQQCADDLAAQQKGDADTAQQKWDADAAAQRQRDADTAAAATLVNTAVTAAQALAAQQLAAQQAVAFIIPTMAALMAHIPPSRARNPSLLSQVTQPAPPVDADLGRACFQHKNGQFCNHVVANNAMTRGIAQSQLETFLSGPGTKILLPITDGGHQFFQVDFETTVDEQIKLALRTLAPMTDLVLGHPGIYSNLFELQHTIMYFTTLRRHLTKS